MKEFELIKQIKTNNTLNEKVKYGIGDDCAVLLYDNINDLLITTDMFVEGTHFLLQWYSPENLAKKILYPNITDIYSCGGIPYSLLLSAGISKNISDIYLSEFIEAFKFEAGKFNISLVGGDTVSSDKITFSVTMFGLVKKNKTIFRSNAKENSYVYITGYPGLSAAGLNILVNDNFFYKSNNYNQSNTVKTIKPDIINSINKMNTIENVYIKNTNKINDGIDINDIKKFLVKKHLVPDIIEDKELLNIIFSNAESMIDVSDGLSNELNHISTSSNIKIVIDYNKIPVKNELQIYSAHSKTGLLDLVLNGGEDYYLLFTSPLKLSVENIFCIGNTEKGKGVFLRKDNSLTKILPKGFEHKN